MKLNDLRYFAQILFLGLFLFIVHKFILFFFNGGYSFGAPFTSLKQLYSFFAFFAICIVSVVLKIKKISLDNTGFAFIAATFIKIAITFFIFSAIIQTNDSEMQYAKYEVFIVFALFSTIETIISIKILNKP